MKYCSECGQSVPPDAQFCENCGHSVTAATVESLGAEEQINTASSATRGRGSRPAVFRTIAVVAILFVAVAVYFAWSEWVAVPLAREVGSYWANEVWGRPEENIRRIDKATWDIAANGVIEGGPTFHESPGSVPQRTFPGMGPYYFYVGTTDLGATIAVWRPLPVGDWHWSWIDYDADYQP